MYNTESVLTAAVNFSLMSELVYMYVQFNVPYCYSCYHQLSVVLCRTSVNCHYYGLFLRWYVFLYNVEGNSASCILFSDTVGIRQGGSIYITYVTNSQSVCKTLATIGRRIDMSQGQMDAQSRCQSVVVASLISEFVHP